MAANQHNPHKRNKVAQPKPRPKAKLADAKAQPNPDEVTLWDLAQAFKKILKRGVQ